ncbi:splicing factor U2af large subunit A-like isoform X2 [Magnolia sinica]|uniref:splicing factor U2af large subunit A-like isoform X2 n=1 Tax=Magnolia sinica TaxID=86752 RepID=UPI00265A4A81|nr:splicing factor U2af large subunit A-like isoform X2 [Magnolia sinica]
MSAIGGNSAGPGNAVVNVYIKHEKKFAFVDMRNVEEVSNAMALDGITFETIHVLNKNEHALDMAAALHHQLGDTDEPNDGNASVKKRTNVLLLGDRLGDLGMSDGLNYENQIVVGFLWKDNPVIQDS